MVLTFDNVETVLKKSFDKTLILVAHSKHCGACTNFFDVFSPMIEENENIIFAKMDTNEQEELTERFNVKYLPSVFFIKNNKIEKIITGNPSQKQFNEAISQLVSSGE